MTMKKLTLAEFQPLYIDWFFEVLECLDQVGLTYSLAYGSMLGAIREGGMIKWDFDIDLFVDETEIQEKAYAIKAYCTNHSSLRFGYANDTNSFGLSRFYADHLTVCRPRFKEKTTEPAHIDLFHYRRINGKTRIPPLGFLRFVSRLSSIKHDLDLPKNTLRRVLKIMLRPLLPGTKFYSRCKQRTAKKIRCDTAGNKLLVLCELPHLEIFDFSSNEIIKAPFSGRMISCFKEYDTFLRTTYGDYLTPRNDGRSNGIFFLALDNK